LRRVERDDAQRDDVVGSQARSCVVVIVDLCGVSATWAELSATICAVLRP
jgi:hypothetical protein